MKPHIIFLETQVKRFHCLLRIFRWLLKKSILEQLQGNNKAKQNEKSLRQIDVSPGEIHLVTKKVCDRF